MRRHKAEWKCFIEEPGEECVLTTGIQGTLTWFADNSASKELCQRHRVRLLEKEKESCGWIT